MKGAHVLWCAVCTFDYEPHIHIVCVATREEIQTNYSNNLWLWYRY